jgi:hypothetical protein
MLPDPPAASSIPSGAVTADLARARWLAGEPAFAARILRFVSCAVDTDLMREAARASLCTVRGSG